MPKPDVTFEIRTAQPDQLTDFRTLLGLAFHFDPDPEEQAPFEQLVDIDRTRFAFDGDEMVGTVTAFSLRLTVPGGTVRCGGTTLVTTKPTHRRRGVLRQLMEAHLDDVAARGEPIAALWASDSGIYGRFGFGQATEGVQVTIRRDEDPFHRLAPGGAPVRLVGLEEAKTLFPAVYEQVFSHRPGCYERDDLWWEHRHFTDPERWRGGGTAQRYAVAFSRGGDPVGYVRYRVKARWEEHHGASEIQVLELMDVTPEATVGLWRLLLTHDLVATIVASNRPIDDPIFDLLAAPRRARRNVDDALWVRIMDVPAALEARRYRTPITVTFQISDPLERVGGIYRLEIDEQGRGHCERTSDGADLNLDLEDLSRAYLGRPRFAQALRTGRGDGDPTTAAQADLAFGWDPAPWCPEVF